MTNSITVLSNSIILQENRQDPITGDWIIEGDKVVICAVCKSAFLEGSWKYMGEKHCNQTQTLSQIPAKQNFKFVKKLEQVIFSVENNLGNTALIVAVPTGIVSFILSILLILNVTNLLWLWGVVAGLVSIPFIFNIFQTKGMEVRETAIYIKKGFGLKRKIPIAKIDGIDFMYYSNFEFEYQKYDNQIGLDYQTQIAYISTPHTICLSRYKYRKKKIQISEYDFNKNRKEFMDFFGKIGNVIPITLLTNQDDLINQFKEKVSNLSIKKNKLGLRYFYGAKYGNIPLS